jgi:serine/threonine-protein kinase
MYAILRFPGMKTSAVAEAASVVVAFSIWLFARGKKRSNAALLVVDAVGTVVYALVFTAMGRGLPLFARPDLLVLICVTDILVLRAFLVPSSTRRTALLGSVACSIVVVSTYFMYRGHRVHPEAPEAPVYATMIAVVALASVIVTTLTSQTIFGLRMRVRQAARIGQYTLLEKIGEGGMGVVYKANHAMLRRPTAIKLLATNRAALQDLARFEREVQLTSVLTHPNTVAIYDYGRTAAGILYYAMEYLDGIDLETLVTIDGPQPAARIVHLLKQVAGALDEAHGIGLIHRDVKPANVLLCARRGVGDVAKVVDFGLVKSIDSQGDPSKSSLDQAVGTPMYMSPEAITAPHRLDGRSDLYALGAVGYFLLVGHPPFAGNTMVEICGHHLHTKPVAPSERLGLNPSPSLERVILSCLEKSPDNRPRDALALMAELSACDDVSAWTAEQAAAWWSKSHERVQLARAGSTGPVELENLVRRGTIAVDLAARAHGANGAVNRA